MKSGVVTSERYEGSSSRGSEDKASSSAVRRGLSENPVCSHETLPHQLRDLLHLSRQGRRKIGPKFLEFRLLAPAARTCRRAWPAKRI